MDIRITDEKPPRVTLTVTEKRGLRSTLKILKGVRDHLEPPFKPDTAKTGEAGLLLCDGFEEFVDQYAPKDAEEEATETDE
jgi:hypothetical protein